MIRAGYRPGRDNSVDPRALAPRTTSARGSARGLGRRSRPRETLPPFFFLHLFFLLFSHHPSFVFLGFGGVLPTPDCGENGQSSCGPDSEGSKFSKDLLG